MSAQWGSCYFDGVLLTEPRIASLQPGLFFQRGPCWEHRSFRSTVSLKPSRYPVSWRRLSEPSSVKAS